jgi:hypothetical protein
VIVAHHLVEVVPALLAGATSGPLLLAAVRARFGNRAGRRRSIRARRRERMSRT